MDSKPRKSKAVRRRNLIIRIVVIVIVIAAVLTAAVFYGRRRIRDTFGTNSADSVLSAQVSVGNIMTEVSGSGNLTSDNIENVTLPEGVKIDTVYVNTGDKVAEGDILASVNTDSVLNALSSVQDELDELDESLCEAGEDAVSDTVTSGIDGRIKVIYAEEGDDVSGVMYENGALLILSLDGYMAVDVEAGGYAAGDAVTVETSDGDEYSGTVEAVTGGSARILITDDGPAYGDDVTVDGTFTGQLYINEPLKITGYAGTVSSVEVTENQKVSADTTLFSFTDTGYSANYNLILSERTELEDTFRELITLYRDGVLYADISGSVGSVPEDGFSVSDPEEAVFTIDPDETMSVTISVDESDILSVEPGQDVSVVIDSIGDNIYRGTVTEIDTTAVSSGGVTVYGVTVTLNKEDGMMDDMTAQATITIEGVENALILPAGAVMNTSTSSFVYTRVDEETGELSGMTEVTAGISNGSYVEILDGLSEGDTVYYIPDSGSSGFDFSSIINNIGGGSGFGGFGGAGGDFDFSNMEDMMENFDFGGGDSGSFGPGGTNGGGRMNMPGN